MSDLTKLVTRLGRHIGRGTGIRLTPDELDILVTSGAFETLSSAAAIEMRELAKDRIAKRADVAPHSTRAAKDVSKAKQASSPEEGRAFIAALTRNA